METQIKHALSLYGGLTKRSQSCFVRYLCPSRRRPESFCRWAGPSCATRRPRDADGPWTAYQPFLMQMRTIWCDRCRSIAVRNKKKKKEQLKNIVWSIADAERIGKKCRKIPLACVAHKLLEITHELRENVERKKFHTIWPVNGQKFAHSVETSVISRTTTTPQRNLTD